MSRYKQPARIEEEIKEKANTKPTVTETKPLPRKPFPITTASQEVKYGEDLDFEQPKDPHILRIAFVGAPNAGKSTLLNSLTKEKISAVSPIAQTTREQILGIHSYENVQLVFMDTPGVIPHSQAKKLPRSILVSALQGINSCPLVILIIDGVYKNNAAVNYLLERLEKTKEEQPDKTFLLILNKADAGNSRNFQKMELGFRKKNLFSEVFVTSALQGMGVDDVRDYLLSKAQPGPWEFGASTKTDMSKLKIVEEAIREQIFQHLRQEVPYIIRQENAGWTELDNSVLRIDQNLYVLKDAQRKIVLGPKGTLLGTIRSQAMNHISKAFQRPVQLYITVKVSDKP